MVRTRTDNRTELAPVSRRARKTQQQRRRVFEIALALFARHGFDEVPVEAITEKADVAKGTFFNYFPSKADVLVAFWAEVVEDVLSYGESIRAESGRACFYQFFKYLARRVRADVEIFDILVRRVGQEPSLYDIDQRTAQRELALFQRFLETGRRSGAFMHGRDTALVAEIVGDLWLGSLRKWIFTGRKFSLERRLEKKLDLLWSAVAPSSKGR